MRISKLLHLFILSLASVGASAADLAASIASDLAAAEQHIIPNTTAYITQTGASNIGLISQEGAITGNFANIGQFGSSNRATASQSGDLNFVNIQQTGNDNIANALQNGLSNAISLTQRQDGNQFDGVQQGNNNTFNVIQNGNSSVNILARGNGNTISADMPTGTNYKIDVVGDNVRASSVGQ
jgi:hypothetical protein